MTIRSRAENALTAVRRDWRGRGIAPRSSRRALAWAAANGVRELVTRGRSAATSDMRALNERLGYVYRSVSITVRADLPAPAETPPWRLLCHELALDLVDEVDVEVDAAGEEAVHEEQVLARGAEARRPLASLSSSRSSRSAMSSRSVGDALPRRLLADEVGEQQPAAAARS